MLPTRIRQLVKKTSQSFTQVRYHNSATYSGNMGDQDTRRYGHPPTRIKTDEPYNKHREGPSNKGALASPLESGAADTYVHESKALMLSPKVSKNFFKHTFTPHIENTIIYDLDTYKPTQLVMVARAYAFYFPPHKRKAVCVSRLVEQIKRRMAGFIFTDVVDVVGALYILAKEDDELFGKIANRVIDAIDDYSAFNLIAVVRVFSKRQPLDEIFLRAIVPRLTQLLRDYDDDELLHMLFTVTNVAKDGDTHTLIAIMPELEKRFDKLPLIQKINICYCLARVEVNHPVFTSTVTRLLTPENMAIIPTDIMSRLVWTFSNVNEFGQIEPKIRDKLVDESGGNKYTTTDFARLCQSVSGPDDEMVYVLKSLATSYLDKLFELSRSEFLEVLLGLTVLRMLDTSWAPVYLPDDDHSEEDCINLWKLDGTHVGQIMSYIHAERDNFRPIDIERITQVFYIQEEYRYILKYLPGSWDESVQETIDLLVCGDDRYL